MSLLAILSLGRQWKMPLFLHNQIEVFVHLRDFVSDVGSIQNASEILHVPEADLLFSLRSPTRMRSSVITALGYKLFFESNVVAWTQFFVEKWDYILPRKDIKYAI